jgi:hypothetical protein
MTGDNSTKSNPNHSYIDNCLNAFYEGRYRDGVVILRDGLDQQVSSDDPIDVKELVKHITAALSYLEVELEDAPPANRLHDGSEIERRCSFCAKKKGEVTRLIAGPGVFICDGCVKDCSDILASDPSEKR